MKKSYRRYPDKDGNPQKNTVFFCGGNRFTKIYYKKRQITLDDFKNTYTNKDAYKLQVIAASMNILIKKSGLTAFTPIKCITINIIDKREL